MISLPARVFLIALTMMPALGLQGCFGGSTPSRAYYALATPAAEQVRRYDHPRFPATLRVRRFTSSLAYDRQEFVYRDNPYELSYDWYRLWVARPSRMLNERMVNYLRLTNLLDDVTDSITERLPDYELSCDVHAIEELNSTEGLWFGHLAMQCQLIRYADNTVVWEFGFADKRPVYERQPVFVVRAINSIYTDRLKELADGVESYLSAAYAGTSPPPRRGNGASGVSSAVASPSSTLDEPTAEPNGKPAPSVLETKEEGASAPAEPSAKLRPRRK